MNRKLALGVLFILAIFTSATYINIVSAEEADQNSSPDVSTTIVISQVYSGGGSGTAGVTYKNDYVELLNVSSSSQSLNGLALQYGSATGNFGGSATQIFALPNFTLQPGQRYLVQLGVAGTAGADLPVTPDAVSTNLSMAAAGGKVALTTTATPLDCGATATPCTLPDPRIIDLVSYGTSNNAEGGVTVNNGTALTNTQGSVRNGNGCTDTDNNNNDFTVVTNPVPRNSMSPTTPCSGGALRGTLYDFTGDGRTDWTTFRLGGTTGAPLRWRVVGNPASAVPNGAFIREFDYGLTGDFLVPADYVGDRKTEMAVWRSGIYYLAQFPTGAGGITLDRAVQWGQSGDDPRSVGDYDGDGKIDYTVRRGDFVNNTVTWFIMSSTTNTMRAVRFGAAANGFLPQSFPGADFTGDGRDELIIVTGAFTFGGPITYIIGDAVTGAGIATIPWGDAGADYAVAPADYTGDGRADLVAWRGRTGTAADAGVWYIRNTATGTATGTRFGIGGGDDLAVRGDYDGDGRHDIGVYRRSNQTFYVLSSSNGSLLFQQSGAAAGDFPLANLFVN
jgi:hypothetical protein